ncbi:MAG TPA: DUF3313 domain-containing protein [Candidatus Binatia bacterium]|nr:DUF3313 domain-containing protein [Candidatus Binatia bacterium]
MVRSTLVIATLALAVVVTGCSATHQARSAKPSGFLRDYTELRPGKKGEALLVYIRPGVEWSKYDAILLEPVTIWGDAVKTGYLQSVPKEEAQVTADYFDASLREALSRDYRLVDKPGADVMRLRVAITEAEGSTVPLDIASTVIPQMRLLSGVKRVATGTAAFVGKAGVEAEIEDSMTEERLAAAVDRQVGQKRLKGMTDTWDDVNGALDYWSDRLRTRLAELRAGQGPK